MESPEILLICTAEYDLVNMSMGIFFFSPHIESN